jgi:type IV secretory pathway VirB10-like protein
MNRTAQFFFVATLAGALIPASAVAWGAQSGSGSQKAQSSQSKPSPYQYSGVSNPPPNSTIVANEPYSDASLPASTPQTPPPPASTSSSTPLPAPAPPPSTMPPATASAPGSASASANPGRYDNTDFGIVTVVPPPNRSAHQATAQDAYPSLQQRPWNPANHIVNYVPVNPNQLGIGTNIVVHLAQPLSSDTAIPGSTFRATVASSVYNGAVLIIPAGSELRGRVARVAQGHHLGLHARIRLQPEVVILPDGTAYHLDASLLQAKVPGTRTTDEGSIVATVRLTKDAVTYGAGAGTGAVVGAVVAGPVGAGVGSIVGAGLATTHLLMQDPTAVNLPRGATLIFGLNQPLLLVPTRN